MPAHAAALPPATDDQRRARRKRIGDNNVHGRAPRDAPQHTLRPCVPLRRCWPCRKGARPIGSAIRRALLDGRRRTAAPLRRGGARRPTIRASPGAATAMILSRRTGAAALGRIRSGGELAPVGVKKRRAIAVGMIADSTTAVPNSENWVRSMMPACRPYGDAIVPKVRPVDISSVVNAACGLVYFRARGYPHRAWAYPPPARRSRISLGQSGRSECAGRWWLQGQDARTRPVLPACDLNPFDGDLDPMHRRAGAEVGLAAVVQDVHVRLLLLPLEPPALG